MDIESHFDMPLSYAFVALVWLVLCLAMMIYNSASGLKDKMVERAENLHYGYGLQNNLFTSSTIVQFRQFIILISSRSFKIVFSSWDYIISNVKSAAKKNDQTRNLIKAEVQEIQRSLAEQNKTTCQKGCR